MASLLTDVAVVEAAGPNLENRLKTAVQVGRGVHVREARYTMLGTEAAGDVISILKLPTGAQVKPELCRVLNEACGGTTGTIAKVGDAGDDDRYTATAIGITSASSTAFTPVAALTNAYVIAAGNETLLATLGLSSGSFTAGKVIVFQIAYLNP